MSILSDRAKSKQIYAQIEELSRNASQIYNSVKHDFNADFSNAISQLIEIYNKIKELADSIPMYRDTMTGKDRNSAYHLLEQLRKQIEELQALQNQSELQNTQQGAGLEGFEDNRPLGNTIESLGQMFPSPYQGNNPQMAALYDLYMQLLSQKQQYDWQRSSDDLAYQRTNFNTLLQQYLAAGMSRASALSAASGGLPSVSGSSVGGSLSPNILGGVAQSQNNAIAQGQLGVAQQNADTALVGTMGQLHQMQQQYQLEAEAQEVALWDMRKKIDAYDQMQRTFELTYSLHANHVDVPTDATISQKAFKDWVRDGWDTYNELMRMLEEGTAQYNEDGSLVYFEQSGPLEGTVIQITPEELKGAQITHELYEEIQKHIGSQEYGILFENLFMSNAGPRAYHQQEDYSLLQQHLISAQTAIAKVDEAMALLYDDSVVSDVNQQVSNYLATASIDDPEYKKIKERIDSLGLVVYNNQICYNAEYEDPSSGQLVPNFVPLSLDDLLKFNLVELGYDIEAMCSSRAALQAARMQNDWTHFKSTLETQAARDNMDREQAETQQEMVHSAMIKVRNKKLLRSFNEFDVIWHQCGFQKIAGGATAFGVGLFKVGSAIKAGRTARLAMGAHHMTESYDKDGNLP